MCIFSVWCDEIKEEEERERTIRLSEEEEKIAHAHTNEQRNQRKFHKNVKTNAAINQNWREKDQ